MEIGLVRVHPDFFFLVRAADLNRLHRYIFEVENGMAINEWCTSFNGQWRNGFLANRFTMEMVADVFADRAQFFSHFSDGDEFMDGWFECFGLLKTAAVEPLC